MPHPSHLLVFSHLRWDFVFQRPQHLMTRLSEDHRVIFIEEPVHDPAGPPRIESRRVGPEGRIEVLVPFTPVAAPGFDDAHLPLTLPLIERELAERGVRDYLVWLYTPMALPFIAGMQPRALVYDCMDELSAFKQAPVQLRQREQALMAAADLVLCGGPALYEARHGQHPHLHCLPSAVDAAHFARPSTGPDHPLAVRARELQGHVPHPRLGFFGVIDERMDLGLVAAVADARPDWQLVMVGPVVKISERDLPQRPNIHWLGMQRYELLPYLLAGWDLCLMPFALNDATRFISPTKTLEYLAGDKPVVSTAIRDVVGLYGDVVRIGKDAPSFIDACEEVLLEDAASREYWHAGAAAVVQASSWEAGAERVRGWLAEVTRPAMPDAPVIGQSLRAA
ncbi:glycosyltransferase [Mitsuaria sp. GD03876]|uniref:glycosyltransferase n=1 Tax=Mitsuaria sp. GD03876 TaxID=2975399 RepID=UPI00244CB178|nr:glycosyltransferase [Mitsuaria sp. GD03876]MDH0868159.1 glycosyltransferase [Mitsuaria sp. GD03876]